LKLQNSAGSISLDNPGIKRAIEVQSRYTEILMGIPDVVGHGIGMSPDGEPFIKIFVKRAGVHGIPTMLEGVPTKVELTGMVLAYADPTAKFDRPVPIGVSTGHPEITAGTIGCRVIDLNGNVFALSNNHIYANNNDASFNDNALQPGPYDGGVDPNDAIGVLYDYEPIDFSGGDNHIDAAIAISSTSDLGTSTPSDGYGMPNKQISEVSPGSNVQKYGRTTGWTKGTVDTINTVVTVCYETKGPFRCTKSARFIDQFSITPGTFSAGGDSGSLIVTDNEDNSPVGLLFAGSTTHTFANQIALVLDRFNVAVDDGTNSYNPPENYPPVAKFSYSISGLMVTFTDESTDSDGSITNWSWDFGDGKASTEQNPTHTYETSGTYDVMLTVTDDSSNTDSITESVTVSDVSSVDITLTATAKQNKVWRIIDLVWSGATSNNVDIYRNTNSKITTTNDGAYTDKISNDGTSEYIYKVCEENSVDKCSNEFTVTF
jgi:PKD repeat protein